MLVLLLAPIAMGLCFLMLWLAFRLKWSRPAVTLACAAIMGGLATVYFAYPGEQRQCAHLQDWCSGRFLEQR